jgi:hypothetical protein
MTSKFGWLQASATKVASLSVTSANPATIRICVPRLKTLPAISAFQPARTHAFGDARVREGPGAGRGDRILGFTAFGVGAGEIYVQFVSSELYGKCRT